MSPAYPVSSNTGGPVSSADLQRLLFDELWAGRGGVEVELALASYNRHRKRVRTTEPDLGAGPTYCMAEFEDRDDAEPPDTRSGKRRKMTTAKKTEDRVTTQMGETQEWHARRTSASERIESKLGNQGLRKETLVAPSQGVHPPVSPRPTTGTTLGPTEFKDQAWTGMEESRRISEGTDDVRDEETDGQRWTRLMVLEEDMWKCRECPGKTFFDRSTLRRHCKSVHGKESDRWKCPLCPGNSYSRKSGLDRHMKRKHREGG